MMKAILFLTLACISIFAGGCAYNTRTNTFGWAHTERPVPPPAYPIPDLSPGRQQATQPTVPPPADY
jgi:hypothetical protein